MSRIRASTGALCRWTSFGFAFRNKRQRHTLCFLQIQESPCYKVERVMTKRTPDSMVILWASLRSNNQFKCWQSKWEQTSKFRQRRLIPTAPETSEGHRLEPSSRFILPQPGNQSREGPAIASPPFCLTSLVFLHPSIQPASFKACLKCVYRTIQKNVFIVTEVAQNCKDNAMGEVVRLF